MARFGEFNQASVTRTQMPAPSAGDPPRSVRSAPPDPLEITPAPVRSLDLPCSQPPRDPSGFSRPNWYVSHCKLAAEFVLALVVLVVAAPVILFLALLVKLTSLGPAFYRQTRVGKDGRVYTIYKLRTMYHNVEKFSGAVWALPRDPRVTDLGRILRATHLDELPQLVNVLKGDMSFVGPRPERPEFVTFLEARIPRYRERLHVRPGITGLAQVHLPPDRLDDLDGVRKKLLCDLYYIDHPSAWTEFRLLLCTGFLLCGIPLRISRKLLCVPNPLP